jgi:hypothetical protein
MPFSILEQEEKAGESMKNEGQEKRQQPFERADKKEHEYEREYEAEHHRNAETERRQNARHKHIGFSGLEKRIYLEYRRKGYSHKTAMDYAKKTAGKVYWQRRKLVMV